MDRWEQTEALLEQAIKFPPEERAAFLKEVCDNTALRQEVISLLAFIEEDTDLFDHLQPKLEALLSNKLAPETPMPECIDRYRLLRSLGAGGMGQPSVPIMMRQLLPPNLVSNPES